MIAWQQKLKEQGVLQEKEAEKKGTFLQGWWRISEDVWEGKDLWRQWQALGDKTCHLLVWPLEPKSLWDFSPCDVRKSVISELVKKRDLTKCAIWPVCYFWDRAQRKKQLSSLFHPEFLMLSIIGHSQCFVLNSHFWTYCFTTIKEKLFKSHLGFQCSIHNSVNTNLSLLMLKTLRLGSHKVKSDVCIGTHIWNNCSIFSFCRNTKLSSTNTKPQSLTEQASKSMYCQVKN